MSLKSPNTNSEKGVAMVEFALIAPLMALLMIGTYDLGNAINQYLALSRVAYETTRYAATLPGLEVTTASEDGLVPVSVQDSDAVLANHDKVRVRARDLLDRAGFLEENPVVQTENQGNAWVVVTIRKEYRSFFGLYDHLPMTVTASGPFLSQKANPNS